MRSKNDFLTRENTGSLIRNILIAIFENFRQKALVILQKHLIQEIIIKKFPIDPQFESLKSHILYSHLCEYPGPTS